MKTISQLLIIYLLLLLPKVSNCQSAGCNYKAGDITMLVVGQSSGANFTTYIVLVDASNIIKYISAPNNTTLINVLAGNYFGFGLTFDNLIEFGAKLNSL